MDPFTAEIRMMANSYAPMDWAECDGQTMYIQQQSMLYAVIGNMYGGNGTTTYLLPNLQGRTAIGAGQGPGLGSFSVGDDGGTEVEMINYNQMPVHNHTLNCFSTQGDKAPGPTTMLSRGYVTSAPSAPQKYRKLYDTALAGPAVLDNRTLGLACAPGQHENRQPYTVLNFYICLYGNFPIKGS